MHQLRRVEISEWVVLVAIAKGSIIFLDESVMYKMKLPSQKSKAKNLQNRRLTFFFCYKMHTPQHREHTVPKLNMTRLFIYWAS